MKKTLYFIISLFIISALIMSCNDDEDDNNDTLEGMTGDEAAELVANSFSEESGGIAAQFKIIGGSADVMNGYVNSKKNAFKDDPLHVDTTIYLNSEPGARIEYSYSFTYSYGLDNTDLLSPFVYVTYSSIGEYEGPRIKSNDETDADFEITGLFPKADNYILNGTLARDGSETFKIRETQFNSDLVLTFNDILITKNTKEVIGGSVEVSLSTNSSKQGSSEFTGSLTYNGDGTATLILNGESYLIDLESGEVTPI